MFLCSRRSMVLATFALVSAMTVPARADDVCADLQSRLANLTGVENPIGDAAAYSSAIAQLHIRLQDARANLQQLGCSTGSVKVYRTSTARQCSEIVSSVEQMERNLRNLEAKRNTLALMGDEQEVRARILAEIETQGCHSADEPDAAQANVQEAENTPDGEIPIYRRATRTGSGGKLRTVCVRTCDGSFVPITSGASPLDFRRDQRACASMCPQTETELYYQSLNSVDGGLMVSTVTGKLYTQLPTAFAYRTRGLSQPQACSCGRSAGNRNGVMAGGSAFRESAGSVTTIRVHPVGSAAASEKVVIERPYDPVKDKVRNVGPVFVPDEPKINLRNPASPN